MIKRQFRESDGKIETACESREFGLVKVFAYRIGKRLRRQRCLVGWLDDHPVAGAERGAEHRQRQLHRKIPR